MTHMLVLSIFLETHLEIGSLTEDFNQLKTFYQTEKDYEIKIKKVLEMNELFSESTYYIENDEEMPYFNNYVISLLQIKKFQKIFYQNTIKENNEQEINVKLPIILDQQEKEAFTNKLCTMVCCKTKTCLTKINHESTFKKFDNIQKSIKVECNMFLLEMLYAMIHSKKTLHDKEKQYITVKYTFDGNEICEKAFQINIHYRIKNVKLFINIIV
ncbi:16731_t:CDS:1 [Cetraspora pellucida]|uniref:16731_t:CDS:1 n=1 Tax=Cetraspora pellucida TaxID=1433469 RepID=A0A9N9DQP1_9GLOM|nr:16731_t:CDS:1 [Cetraspora pellucida]